MGKWGSWICRRLLHSTILILNYVPNSWMTFEYLWVSGVASKQHVLAVGRCRTAGRFPSEWGSCLHISPRGSSERPSFYELRSLAESVASRAAGYTILQVSLMLSVDSKAERSQGSKGVVEHGWTKRIVQVTTELLDILLHQSFGHPLVYQCLPEVPDEFIIRSKHICGVLTMAIHFGSILKFLCFNDDHWRVLPPEFDSERLNGSGHFPVFLGNCLVIRCKFFEVTLPHLSIASWHAHDSDVQLVGSCPCYGRLAWCDLHLEIVHV
jgi:hypothetical protein